MANEANEIVFDKKIIDDLLAEVNGELTAMLKSQKDDLSKAIQENSPDEQSEGSEMGMPLESLDSSSSDSSSSDSSSSDSSSSSSDSSDSSSSDSSSSDSSSSDSSGSSSDSSSGSSDSGSSGSSSDSDSSGSSDASGEPMMMDQNQDPSQDQQTDGMDLKAEYMKLPPDQLKAHLEAAKAALMQMMGSENDAQPKEEMKKDPMDMGKMQYSEESKEKEVEAKDKDKDSKDEMLSKKESDEKIGKLEAQLKEQSEAFDKLTNLLLKPIRKSVTQENEVEDDAPVLSKDEAKSKLKEKLCTNLNKSDRALINEFYLGHVGLDKLKHLLS